MFRQPRRRFVFIANESLKSPTNLSTFLFEIELDGFVRSCKKAKTSCKLDADTKRAKV